MFTSLRSPQHTTPVSAPTQPRIRHGKKEENEKGRARSLHEHTNNKQKNEKVGEKSLQKKQHQTNAVVGSRNSHKPRVVGTYAYQISDLDGWKEGRNIGNLPPYIYLTERIDPYLLSHTPQALRRIRNHNHYHSEGTSLSDIKHNYDLAIAGSIAEVTTEDPLKHLMLTSESRDTLNGIRFDSEDYGEYLADPLEDKECEATPANAKWMLHSFPTCNFHHEFSFPHSVEKDKTKILGHGYWRDVWPVFDTALVSSRFGEMQKVALKTMRYEHDYTGRNYDRHVRDAIASERLTSSPRVTDIYSFCGNSGYFEFASGGSLANRLDEHYTATVEAEDEEDTGRHGSNDDSRILDQRAKLKLAFEISAGLADFHEVDAMRDENGEIVSASIAHADISTDQFIHVGDGYKLNDFNRCRFMRRYRNSTSSGGDGKPCGFHVHNNPGKARAPEEYAYTVETEKVDIFSLGNIFYTIITNIDPWEDTPSEKANKAVMEGKRPKVPSSIKSSEDPADLAIRKMMYKCWEQKPDDRPRARYMADYFLKKLNEWDDVERKKND